MNERMRKQVSNVNVRASMFHSFVGLLGGLIVLVGARTEIHPPQKMVFYFHDGNMKGFFRLRSSVSGPRALFLRRNSVLVHVRGPT